MNNPLLVSLLFLVPAFILLNEDFSLESASLRSIQKMGDRTSVRSKLAELGFPKESDYENFRYKELIISNGVTFFVLLFGIYKDIALSVILALLIIGISASILIIERNLSSKVKKYREQIEEEFPVIIEMLTLSISAGESPLSSFQRVSERGSGALISNLRKVVSEVSEGKPFEEALDALGRRMHSLNIRRFIDSIVVALSRGASLVDVLQSHAEEAQSLQRNRVTALAAKAEMSMMIPVVFLILPISILFALWPSLSNLNIFAQS